MKVKISDYLVGLSVIAILLANATLGYADEQIEKVNLSADEDVVIEDFEEPVVEEEAVEESMSEEKQENLDEQQDFLDRLTEELNLSKSDYHQLLNNVSDTKEKLNRVTEERVTLRIQIRNLDALIQNTTEKLIDIVAQVVETENDIALLYEQIELREIAFEYQKSLLQDYLRVLYQEQNTYLSIDENGEINTVKLLLGDGTVSDTLKEMEYLDLLNVTGQQMLDRLSSLYNELIQKKTELEGKKAIFTGLEEATAREKEQLEIQREAKENLLTLTKGQEEIYSQLLEQTIEEQGSVVEDIRTLSTAIGFIERDINNGGDYFDPDTYTAILNDKNKAIYDFHLRYRGQNPTGFSWPVEPFKGISAYFRDPGYVGVFGVNHNAVDIPAYQGTPIRSAADGVVYTAKDNGYGYSYIIVAHSGGVSTVYGHVNKILVNVGDTVSEGSIIALSGGMPGTKGSGYMTTGPHLHFEVHLDGNHVDPLEYLPLEGLSEDHIGNLPEKYRSAWEIEVYGRSSDLVQRF